MNRNALTFPTGLLSCVLTACLLLTACSPYPYINIPPEEGDVARHGSNSAAVREVESVSLRAILADDPVDGAVAVVLIDGSNGLSYDVVLPTVSEAAVSPRRATEVETAARLEVRAVRVRGMRAEVDIARTTARISGELVTVYLKQGAFSGWHTERVRRWGSIPDASIVAEMAPPEVP